MITKMLYPHLLAPKKDIQHIHVRLAVMRTPIQKFLQLIIAMESIHIITTPPMKKTEQKPQLVRLVVRRILERNLVLS